MDRLKDWSSGGLADEHEVVRARKVLAQEPEFAQTVGGHEMGVVKDRDKHFVGAMDAEELLRTWLSATPREHSCRQACQLPANRPKCSHST